MASVHPLNLLAPPRRVSLRRRLSDGALGDVVGHVVEEDESSVTVLPEDRPAVTVRRSDVVAVRTVPPRVVRPRSSAAHLTRFLAGFWPGVEQARLGGWLLRAGAGATKRANSCLIDGDPGLPQQDAVRLVTAWYQQRGLTPHLLVPGPIVEDRPGWESVAETAVWAGDVRAVASTGPRPDLSIETSESPDPTWLTLWRSGAGHDEAAYRVLTAAPASYVTARLGGEAVAVVRVAVAARWAHLSCLEVRPDAHGRGLGASVSGAALAWARAEHAVSFAAAEVLVGHGAAERVHARLGLAPHHRYHYRRLADPA